MHASIDWARDAIENEIEAADVIVETVYSSVHRLKTTDGYFILKKVPPAFYTEAHVLERLGQGKASNAVPTLVAKDDNLHIFMTSANGQHTLRAFLKEHGTDVDLIRKGLDLYQSVQASTAGDTDAYLRLCAPDWRLDQFPNLYRQIIENDELMTLWKMDAEKRQALQERVGCVNALCQKLAGYNLPDTLTHCDLHNNNIVIDANTKALTLIDWAEVAICNPLISVEPFFRSLRKHHNMTRENSEYQALQNSYIAKWDIPIDEGRQILNVLGNIYYIQCMRQLMDMTGEKFEKWTGDLTGALDDFLLLSDNVVLNGSALSPKRAL